MYNFYVLGISCNTFNYFKGNIYSYEERVKEAGG